MITGWESQLAGILTERAFGVQSLWPKDSVHSEHYLPALLQLSEALILYWPFCPSPSLPFTVGKTEGGSCPRPHSEAGAGTRTQALTPRPTPFAPPHLAL